MTEHKTNDKRHKRIVKISTQIFRFCRFHVLINFTSTELVIIFRFEARLGRQAGEFNLRNSARTFCQKKAAMINDF